MSDEPQLYRVKDEDEPTPPGVTHMAPPPAHQPALSARHEPPWFWGWCVALLGWSLLLAFFNLPGGAEFEPTDCWVAQTAREMQEADRWVVPVFSGEIRLQKSPGPYWATMGVSELLGRPVDKVAARVPSALTAVLLVMVVCWLTRRIAGARAAIFAGFATAGSILFLYWSHRAASDLGVAAFIALSVAAFWIALECEKSGPRRGWLLLLGYFAAGLGMLYKMPMPLACVGLPAYLYLLKKYPLQMLFTSACLVASFILFKMHQPWVYVAAPTAFLLVVLLLLAMARWATVLTDLPWHLVGFLLFLLPWMPWVLLVIKQEPTALWKWKVEFLDRFTGELPNVEDQTHWYFNLMYFVPVLLYTFPFTLSLPAAVGRAFRRQEGVRREGTIFMLLWFFGLFAFFTASAGKELRYILPALPPLFVLLGIELADLFSTRRKTAQGLLRAAVAGVVIGTPLAFVGGAFGLRKWWKHQDMLFDWPTVWQPYAVAAAIFTIGAIIAVVLYYKGRRNGSFAALVATMWAFWMILWSQMMPILASEKAHIEFSEKIRNKIPVEMRDHLRMIGPQDARIIWYSDVRFPRLVDPLMLLEKQDGRRDRDWEVHQVGKAMIDALSSDEPVLLVASNIHYIQFMLGASEELEKAGRAMPRTYLWLASELGSYPNRNVVFGNVPPPWPQPEFPAPPRILEALEAIETTSAPASMPATQAD